MSGGRGVGALRWVGGERSRPPAGTYQELLFAPLARQNRSVRREGATISHRSEDIRVVCRILGLHQLLPPRTVLHRERDGRVALRAGGSDRGGCHDGQRVEELHFVVFTADLWCVCVVKLRSLIIIT